MIDNDTELVLWGDGRVDKIASASPGPYTCRQVTPVEVRFDDGKRYANVGKWIELPTIGEMQSLPEKNEQLELEFDK